MSVPPTLATDTTAGAPHAHAAPKRSRRASTAILQAAFVFLLMYVGTYIAATWGSEWEAQEVAPDTYLCYYTNANVRWVDRRPWGGPLDCNTLAYLYYPLVRIDQTCFRQSRLVPKRFLLNVK